MDPFEADSLHVSTTHRPHRATYEAAALSLLALALGIAARPLDPLSVQAEFPWPVLAVLVIGLRYGFPSALFSAAVLHAGAFAYDLFSGTPTWPLPFAYSVGCAIVSVVAGEYRESWGRRLDTVERSNAYRQARLEEFTRTYHVLKLSHDRLEQDNAGNQTSLRSSLLTVRSLFHPRAALEDNANAVLDLFRRYCAVVSGGFYLLDDADIRQAPAARAGTVNAAAPNDVLVRQAIAERRVVSVNPGNPAAMSGRTAGDPLVAVPFVDSFGSLRAMLIVTELPFFSYTERTLQLMAILGGQIADFTRDRSTFPEGLDVESASFVSEILRSLEYARNHGLATTLVAIRFSDQTAAPAYIATMDQQSRGLDRLLSVGAVGDMHAMLIMPLTGAEEYAQFLTRFERYLIEAHGAGPQALGVDTSHLLLTSVSRLEDVSAFLRQQPGAETIAAALDGHEREARHAVG